MVTLSGRSSSSIHHRSIQYRSHPSSLLARHNRETLPDISLVCFSLIARHWTCVVEANLPQSGQYRRVSGIHPRPNWHWKKYWRLLTLGGSISKYSRCSLDQAIRHNCLQQSAREQRSRISRSSKMMSSISAGKSKNRVVVLTRLFLDGGWLSSICGESTQPRR